MREFFWERGFTEVETPVRITAPALERHVDAEPCGKAFLRTSPELHMKRLLVRGWDRIFQIGPCFRKGEAGRIHLPEFTLLEWYRRRADYLDMLVDTKALLAFVGKRVVGSTRLVWHGEPIELLPVWDCLSVQELFLLHAGWDPVTEYDDDRFWMDWMEKVEPMLPRDRPVIVKDYPPQAAALARCRSGPPQVAERWELYLGGMELANAYSELTDPVEQRIRFEICARERAAAGAPVYPLDEAFLHALAQGLPPCGGVALGIDRLVMLLAGCTDIRQTRPFAEEMTLAFSARMRLDHAPEADSATAGGRTRDAESRVTARA